MEVTCPTAGRHDQEMTGQQQQGPINPPQSGPSLTDREAHDLSTNGYTILSLQHLCNTASAAKAKRKAYKSERQKKQEKRNAFHARNNKDRIIQAKSFEIEDLCARIEGLKEEIRDLRSRLDGVEEEHRQEIELMTEMKDIKIQLLQVDIEKGESMLAQYKREQKEMKREHAAELESRDAMQAVLLVDFRELTQVYDEEIELLRRTIDRQGKCTHPSTCLALTPLTDNFLALPPDYSSINNLTSVIALRDANSATPEHTIATALSNLRKALAAPTDSDPSSKHLVHIANTLHTSLLTIKQGFTTHLWPRSATSASLHAIHECVDRVVQFLFLRPDLCDQSTSRLLHQIVTRAKNANTLLRRAFSCADTLALELCSLHFSSGGRRAGLMLPSNPLPLPSSAHSRMTMDEENNEIDTKDDLLELQYWKRKFENVRKEALEWKEEVGVTVFGDTGAWLEQEVMVLV